MRPSLLQVIWISCDLDILVRLKRDEFERAGADRVLAHVACRHMAGIDRREPGSESREKGWLRPLQVEGDLVVAACGDPLEVPIPGLAGVDAELVARVAGQQVKSAHDVPGRERLAVVPSNAFA